MSQMNFNLKPITTEKAVMMIEKDNVISFQTSKEVTKTQVKEEVENLFKVKVAGVRTVVRDNKKNVYVKLKKEFPAIDIATKLGVI